MTAKVKIKDLAPGAVFDVGLLEVRVLEHFADGTSLVVTNREIGSRTFTTVPFSYKRTEDYKANDFAVSTLHEDLNTGFLTDLLSAAPVDAGIKSEDIADHRWDLADSDGGTDYGAVICKIAILSQTEYLKYINAGLLPEDLWDDWEWTRTPNAGNANHARSVHTAGGLRSHHAYYGLIGVRPAFYLKSGTLVSIQEDQADFSDQVLLKEYSSRRLVGEVLRRIAAGEVDEDE